MNIFHNFLVENSVVTQEYDPEDSRVWKKQVYEKFKSASVYKGSPRAV